MSLRSNDFHRFMEHLPLDATDRVLVVLKGHLLVEELLHEFVNCHFKNANKLKEARLTFYQYLCLASGLSHDDSNGKLWDSIERLNNLRNKLAHSLEPKNVDDKINAFVNLLSDFGNSEEITVDNQKYGVLAMCIFTIHSSLSSILGEAKEENNITIR